MAQDKDISFGTALSKLEESVERIEKGDVELEELLVIFSEGMKTAAICQKKLNEAQQRIDIVQKEYDTTMEKLKAFGETSISSED